ncbi:ABC transporter substrate-binding protein [Humitalea sp. 24SJ18S-53]|uniref:ABC transporter substrate-binding protein n=1 Tax=Humitalea sp. 24SJ18S-53 TaxID=3422307 RepID=UPI003D66ADDA
MTTRRLALAALAVPFLARPAFAAERMAVRLDWSTWGSQAPFYLAMARGWYAREDLDVSIEDGNGSVATVQLVGNGQFDVGHASLAPMMIARGRGIPVRAIASFARQNDIGLMLPRDRMPTETGPAAVAALRGRTLAFTPGSLETPFLDRFLASGNLQRTDVQLLSVDAAAKIGTYIAGRADGVFSAIPFAVPLVEAQRPAGAIRFADHGLVFPSFGLFATERSIGTRAPALRRFASITTAAWMAVAAGAEDEAIRAMQAAKPQARLNPTVLRAQIDSMKTFFTSDATAGQPLGIMAESDWATGVDNLAGAGQIERREAPGAYFTNDLLDVAAIRRLAGA